MTTAAALRRTLVAELMDRGSIRSAPVRRAFERVPRERFVPEIADTLGLAHVYANLPLVTAERDGVPTSSSSQPSIMAAMLEGLDVHKGHRVLEIGLGTGYNAALLAHLVGPTGRVTSVDIDAGVVARAAAALDSGGHRVDPVVADGRAGWAAGAPYDRILVAASSDTVPRAWWDQLAPGGVLVVPLRLDALQVVAVFTRTAHGLTTTAMIPGGFMSLRDSATATGDTTPQVSVRMFRPGHDLETVTVLGPGLLSLSARHRRSLVAYLMDRPRRRRIPAHPLSPLALYTALTTAPDRHLTVHIGISPPGFGLVDPASGAFSVLAGQYRDGRYSTTAIETYGPDPGGATELAEHLRRWRSAGSPSIDRLAIDVSYAGARRPVGGRTVRHADHTIHLTWR